MPSPSPHPPSPPPLSCPLPSPPAIVVAFACDFTSSARRLRLQLHLSPSPSTPLSPPAAAVVFKFFVPLVIVRAHDYLWTIRIAISNKGKVIANGFCKKLCLRMCAELSHFASVTEGSSTKDSVEVGSSTAMEWESLEREHRAYSYLCHCFVSPVGNGECIAEAIRASSTDNYPDESIENTLIETDRVHMRPSYWSSQGESDHGAPETLTYRLDSKLCIVNEIKVQPFEAYFQLGNPIYSAKAVRFRMGHYILTQKTGEEDMVDCTDEKFVWTYVSPEFPMAQQNELQSFKLPRPVICIGGIVQIELLGRVQVQEMDNLYYICVCHVQVVGRPLSPVFEVDMDDASGSSVLKFFPEKRNTCTSREANETNRWNAFSLRERLDHLRALVGWNHPILNTLLRVAASDPEDDDEPVL